LGTLGVVDRDEATTLSGGVDIAGDDAGRVHLLYASQNDASRHVEARYLHAPVPEPTATSSSASKHGRKAVPSLGQGEGISSARIDLPIQGVTLAVDPESGYALAASNFHGALT
jgi:hypothetical protein